MGLFVDKLTGNIYLFDIPNSSGGTGGSGSTYTEVNTFADLPPASSFATRIFVVRTSTGTYMINRREAGLYYSNGVVWRRLGDIPSFFNDDNFEIYDGNDNTKRVKFQASGLTTSTLRTVTLRNSDGTMAYLSDITGKLNTSVFNSYTGVTETRLDGIEADIDYISAHTGNAARFGTARYVATTNNHTASDPGNGKLKWNNATLTASTRIFIDSLTDSSVDIDNFLSKVSAGTVLYIQELNDSNNTQTWEITGLTNNGGWWTLGVDFLGGSGSFSNNNKIGIMIGSVISDTITRAEFTGYTATTETRIQKAENFGLYGIGTGMFTGGSFTHSGGTTFTVHQGVGIFIDQYTNPTKPFSLDVSWNTANYEVLTGTPITYVSMSSGGTLIRRAGQPNSQQRREEIILGLIVHTAGIITTVIPAPIPAYDIMHTTQDIFQALGLIRTDDGNRISAAGNNMQLKKSAGNTFYASTNLVNNNKDPNFKFFTEELPLTFQYRDIEGIDYGNTTIVDPTKYERIDSGGTTSTLVTVTGSTAQATVQRVFMFQSGGIRLQYGQRVYPTLLDAFTSFLSDPFTLEQDIQEDGLLIGVIVMRVETSNLSNGSDAIFVTTSRTGSVLGASNSNEFVMNKFQLVKTLADFPEPIGGDIFLQDDFEYRINGTVDIKGNRLVLANNNAFIGENSSIDIMVGSGTSMIYGRGKSVTISTIRLGNTVSGNSVFDVVGNGTGFFAARRTIFPSTRVGRVGNFSVNILDNIFLSQTYDGLIISGQSTNVGDVFISDASILRPRPGSRGIVITGGSFNSIRVSGSHFQVTGTTVALTIVSGTSLTTNGVLHSNQFFGNGTYLNGGLTKAAPNWDFRGNTNLLDSETFGFLRFSGNTTVTTINATTDFVKAAGSNFNSLSERVTVTNNRLTNNSNKTLNFIALFTGDLSVGGGTETIQIALVKNGTQRVGTVEARTTTANQPVPFAYNDIVSLAQGDYVEVFVRNLTSTADITMRNLQFRINLS